MSHAKYLTREEVFARKGEYVICDIETYANYFLVCMEYVSDGARVYFEGLEFNRRMLFWMMTNNTIVGFNSMKFDVPIIHYVLFKHPTYDQISDAVDDLINQNVYYRTFMRDRKLFENEMPVDQVDLIEVAPLDGSLKVYAGRMGVDKMQDLPYIPGSILSNEEKSEVLKYCWNDTHNTLQLYKSLKKEIDLRIDMSRQYKTDLKSKSDAQIAEAVISTELLWKFGISAKKRVIVGNFSFNYEMPSNVVFTTPLLQNMQRIVKSAVFTLDENGSPVLPNEIASLALRIGNTDYQIGMGGLHSKENRVTHLASNSLMYVDRDVASYYPRIILNQNLFPNQLTKNFLTVYESIVTRRLKAKETGDTRTANTLKIVINGSFGKFGNKYSILYSPELLIQTTLSGQLYLFMLIERLECAGFSVVSANTDGVVTQIPIERKEEFDGIVSCWERDTGFDTEETQYQSLRSRDVNNYLAITTDGKIKSKGVFAETGLSKNPNGGVVYDAVRDHLLRGTDIEDYVSSCTDVRKFLFVRRVKGGATKNGSLIGKVVRWYMKKGEYGCIKSATSGNKVPNTDGAEPLMDISSGLPPDVDVQWYIREAKRILREDFSKPEQFLMDLN